MSYDKEKITQQLIERRNSYRTRRRKACITAGITAAALALVMAVLIPVLAQKRAASSTREATAFFRQTEDMWYGGGSPSDGWYNEPLDRGFDETPRGYCVRMQYGGEDMVYNLAEDEDAQRLTDLICSLESVGPGQPEPGREDVSFVVLFTKGRRVFRLTGYSDGRCAINDRGLFRPAAEENELERFVTAQADIAKSEAHRSIINIGGDLVVAYTVIPKGK